MLSRSVFLGFALSLVSACSWIFDRAGSPPQTFDPATLDLLNDEFFTAGSSQPAASLASFLELPAEIRHHLDQSVVPIEDAEKRYVALRSWAFDEFQGDYEYDPSFTSPLGEILDNKRINCFSFSNLFVAAARYADIPADFQLVHSPPQWNIDNETWVVSQHINVTGTVVGKLSDSERRHLRAAQRQTGSRIQRVSMPDLRRTYVVDLNPEIAADSYRSNVIDDRQAYSLFYSNRTAEALIAGNVTAAMEYARQAILADQESTTAWNNLGVLFSRAGKLEQAKQAYLAALALDPRFESSANNLERVYRRLGEDERANAMAQRIRENRIKNPYYHYSMGQTMLKDGELENAADHFRDAIKRKDDEKLFYYSLAETHYRLGNYKQALKNLKAAKKHSSPRDMVRYHQLHSQLASVTGKS